MFFYLAKVLWFLLQPSTLIALLIAYGSILIWTGWARWGRRFVSVGAALLLIAGLSPLGNALILPLEDRFARTNLDQPPPPTGFIVLGGAEDRLVGTAAQGADAERGRRADRGDGDARPQIPRGEDRLQRRRCRHSLFLRQRGDGAQRLLTEMGVAPDRLILESGARDTYENAVYLKAELGKLGLLGPGKRWVMITSAYHMPRAMASFRQAGFDVEPWPVDYRTRGRADLTRPFDKVSEGLRRVDVATREWVGLFAYWLAGRSDLVFPAPKVAAWAATSLRRKPAVRQAPHVDPILEIGRGAEVGTLFAAIGRNHLAQHAEARAGGGLVPHHGFLRRRAGGSAPSHPAARRGCACGSGNRRGWRRRGLLAQGRPDVGGVGREGEADAPWGGA